MREFRKMLGVAATALAVVGSPLPVMAQELPENPGVASEELNFGDPEYGGRFIVASTAEPEGFNPIVATATSTIAITDMVFDGLITIDPVTLELVPALAERWETSENGRVHTFYLREGVNWSDGVPLTADDVVFTYNSLIFNEDVDTDTRPQLTFDGEYVKVEKIDDYTVRFTFPQTFAPAVEALTTEIMPEHVLADEVHKLNPEVPAGNFNETWSLSTDPEEIVGTGPFTVEEYAAGRHVLLERNPYYWMVDSQGRRLPYLDEVLVLFVEDPNTAVLRFLNGETDAISIAADQYATLKRQESSRDYTVYNAGSGLGTSHNFGFNQDVDDPALRALFRNVKFRWAMSYALDRETVISNVYAGLAVPQWGPISAANKLYYSPDLKEYPFDLEKADRLLDELGLEDSDGDGIREMANGQPLEFVAITNSGSLRAEMANLYANDLKKIGVRLIVQTLEFGTVIDRMINGDYQVAIMSLVGSRDPYFTGVNVFGSQGGFHYWHWSAKEDPNETERRVDELLSKAGKTLDEELRKEYYAKYQRLLSEQVPILFTVQPAITYAVWDDVGNIGETPSPFLEETGGSLFLPLAHVIYKKDAE